MHLLTLLYFTCLCIRFKNIIHTAGICTCFYALLFITATVFSLNLNVASLQKRPENIVWCCRKVLDFFWNFQEQQRGTLTWCIENVHFWMTTFICWCIHVWRLIAAYARVLADSVLYRCWSLRGWWRHLLRADVRLRAVMGLRQVQEHDGDGSDGCEEDISESW